MGSGVRRTVGTGRTVGARDEVPRRRNCPASAVARCRDIASGIVPSVRGIAFPEAPGRARPSRPGPIHGPFASAGDNAAMERRFSVLQKNVLNRHPWAARGNLRIAIVSWITRTYDHRRHEVRLGRPTPIEFETIMNGA